MPRHRTTWTPEADERLRKFYNASVPMAGILKELGCSVKAVYCRAHLLGLHRPKKYVFKLTKYTEEQFEFVRKHYPDMSNKTLSVVSDVKVNAIRKWRQIFGWHKSERYRSECKEYARRNRQSSERRRILQREYARRYREKYPERVAESKRRHKMKMKTLKT